MDFALTLPNFHYGAPPSREHILAVARAAEESGFTSVWASDHFFPKPAQPGGPPLWIGGNSDAALTRTATLGDAWHADEVPPDEFVVRVASMNQQASAAGRKVAATIRYTVDKNLAMGTRAPDAAPDNGAGVDMKGPFEAMRAFAERYRTISATDFICQFEHRTAEQHVDFIRAFGREIIARQ